MTTLLEERMRRIYWVVESLEYPDGGYEGHYVRWADTAEVIARCDLKANAELIVSMHNATVKLGRP